MTEADCIAKLELERDEARAERDRLREALQFYADKFSWRTRSGKVGITPLTDGRDAEIIDGHWTYGKLARAALGESRGKGDA